MVDVSFNQMKKYIENQVDDEIKPLEDFVNTYSYTENEKQIIIEFIGIHQLIYDDKVKKHLITETCKKCDVLFISKLNQIKNEYQQYIIEQYVKNHYSYLNFRKRFPLN